MRKLILPILVLVVALPRRPSPSAAATPGRRLSRPPSRRRRTLSRPPSGRAFRHSRCARQAGWARQDAVRQGTVHGLRADRCGLQEGPREHAQGAADGPSRATASAPLPRGQRPLSREAGGQAALDRDPHRRARKGEDPRTHRPRWRRPSRPGGRAHLKRRDPRDQPRADPTPVGAHLPTSQRSPGRSTRPGASRRGHRIPGPTPSATSLGARDQLHCRALGRKAERALGGTGGRKPSSPPRLRGNLPSNAAPIGTAWTSEHRCAMYPSMSPRFHAPNACRTISTFSCDIS